MGSGKGPGKIRNSTGRPSTAAGANTEDDDEVSIKQFVIYQLHKFFVDHIPMESLKELPPQCKYIHLRVFHLLTFLIV